MKRNVVLFAYILCAICSCSKIDYKDFDSNETITLIAHFEDNSNSKTTLSGTSVLWEASDEIKLFYDGTGSRFTNQYTEASGTAKFSGSISTVFLSNEGFAANTPLLGLYPYREDATADNTSITTTLPSEQVGKNGSFAQGTNISIGKSTTLSMGFYNVCGGVRFTLSRDSIKEVIFKGNNHENLSGKVHLSFDGSIPVVSNVVSGIDSIILIAPDNKPFKAGEWYYIVALPGTLSNGFTLTFLTDNKYAELISSKVATIQRGVFGSIASADEGLVFKDRQKADAVDLSANGTANCYIVNNAGTYRFIGTVKGETQESIGTPLKAKVLWESYGTDVTPSVGDIVKDVAYNGCYVQFSTPTTLNNGNAVIAVLDASDKILWSWHIWVCKDYNPTSTAQVYNNKAGTMMDRNLGAISVTPGASGTCGLLYQWGRKDPFIGYSSLKDKTYSTIEWPTPVASDNSHGTISYATANPTTFITYNSANYDWYYTGDSSTDDTRWQNLETTKGIYDPCPKGWRVPDGGGNGVWSTAFGVSSFSYAPWDATNKGMDFGSGNGKETYKQLGSDNSIWYPSSGNRNQETGKVISGGSSGLYWSCTPSSSGIYYLTFQDFGYVYTTYDFGRASGLAVRCIKDEQPTPIEYVDLGLSVKWATCNIGASAPEESGRYFAWGDVAGQTWDGSSWSDGGFSSCPSYELDSDNNLKPQYDAAHTIIGSSFRMPTYSEMNELLDNCTTTWTIINGVYGRLFTSKKEGYTNKSIFLPAAGRGEGTGLSEGNIGGNYWSSTFGGTAGDVKVVWSLGMYSDGSSMSGSIRNIGKSIRPVIE